MDEWMNVYITIKMEKYQNSVHVDKKKNKKKYLETFSLIIDSNVLKLKSTGKSSALIGKPILFKKHKLEVET